MDRLQAMRVFVTVYEKRSLSTAAATIGMSLPAVSRILSALEKELAVRLLSRSTRGLNETDGGRMYYRRCQKILSDVHEADAAVQSHTRVPVGELRVTAPVTFGRYHVAPSTAEFLERFQRLSVYLSLTDQVESLPEQRLDVAIRVAVLRTEGVTARRLGYIQRAVVGSRDYFAKHSRPGHPRDLVTHSCMHFTHYSRADEWIFDDGGRAVTVKVRGRMRTNNQEALLDAVLAGAGLAVLPTWLIREPLQDGRLQRVLTSLRRLGLRCTQFSRVRGYLPIRYWALVEFLAEQYRERQILAAEGHVTASANGTATD